MSVFEHILAGVDGHEGGMDALALAGLLSDVSGASLTALHVYPFDRSVSLDRAEEYESGLRDELVGHVREQARELNVDARSMVVADASAARALHAEAERQHADLLVVGSSHRQEPYRSLLGDVCAATLHGSPCAVAVAPSGYAEQPRALRRIGVGFDGSAEARRALALARRFAAETGAVLRILMVAAPPPPAWTTAQVNWSDYEEAAVRAGNRQVAAARAELEGEDNAEVVIGDPGVELAMCSNHLDLLVLGSRSYGPLRRLLLGSTSTRVVRDSECPVLILPRSAPVAGADPASVRATAT